VSLCGVTALSRGNGHSMLGLQVEVPIEPDEGLLADAPLALFYGHTSPTYNLALYKAQIDRCVICRSQGMLFSPSPLMTKVLCYEHDNAA
jgi:hypothetical protein